MSEIRIADLPNWYDRNPINRQLQYLGANIAPHIKVIRATYTVPDDKMAFVHTASLLIERIMAAGSVARIRAQLVAFQTVIWVYHYDNVVHSHSLKNLSPQGIGLADEPISLYTEDPSTGGTMDYALYVGITEFDAITRIHQEPIVEPPKRDIQEPNGNNGEPRGVVEQLQDLWSGLWGSGSKGRM